MDETTYSDPAIITLINQNFIPIRVDADQYPHVHDRYVAGGWPTNAFLTPTGEVLWAGTYIPPDQFAAVAESVRSAWTERRNELGAEIERRRKALEAARNRVSSVGLVRRDAADDVWNAVTESFDARNGGFGSEPKYPAPDAIELVFMRAKSEPAHRQEAAHTLDGMIAGELWDVHDGGFFRYALAADWTEPQREKLLSVNAGLLRVYALGAALHDRSDWRAIAERIVDWANQHMALPSGLWSASQAAMPEYYDAPAKARASIAPPPIDPIIYTSANAQWIRALAEAGARIDRPDWIVDAARALTILLDRMAAPNKLLFHYSEPYGEPQLPHLLSDAVEAARAALAVAQASGDPDFLVRARSLVLAMESCFWADDGGFYDRIRSDHDVGVLRYRDRPFDLNAEMARLLIDVALAFGERSFRALAERTLAVLSPLAGRYGVVGASFALAVHEFFEPPLQLFITGNAEEAAGLRSRAAMLPLPSRRVWPLPNGGRIGTQTYALHDRPAVYVVGHHGMSRAITEPTALASAVVAVS